MEEFTEEELHEILKDLRFFFPDEGIYIQLDFFRKIDVSNDCVSIKDQYKQYNPS